MLPQSPIVLTTKSYQNSITAGNTIFKRKKKKIQRSKVVLKIFFLDLNLSSDNTLSTPDIVSLDRRGDRPQHTQDDLNNEHGSCLRTSVGAKGVKSTPAALKRTAYKVEKPEERQNPTNRDSRIPQKEKLVLVREAVHELGHHGKGRNYKNKNKGRRGFLRRCCLKLKVDVISHDTEHNTAEKELNEPKGEYEQIGRGKRSKVCDLGKERVGVFLEWVPASHCCCC